MKKTSVFLMVLLVICSATCWAQQYHDAEVEELKGHVKSYTLLRGGESATVNFTQDGKIDSENDFRDAVYNKKGYMVSCNRLFMDILVPYTISYNSKNQPTKQVMDLGEGTITQEFTYNSDGTVKTEKVTIRTQSMSQSTTITYTYEAFDSHGSWTRRIATVGNQSETQTRVITYW